MSATDLALAANAGVPANALKPHNCHEAALGWVLMAKYPTLRQVDPLSQGVPKAWLALRSLAERYGTGNPKQLTGAWMGQHIYHRGFTRVMPLPPSGGQRLSPFTHASFLVGDVLFMGQRAAPHHSMVVVAKNGTQAMARGFNNAGAFGGPYMDWDPALRDMTDPERWDAQGHFRGNNGPCDLYAITYNAIVQNIPDNLNF